MAPPSVAEPMASSGGSYASWLACMGGCERACASWLGGVAAWCARRPCLAATISLVCALACCAGFANFNVESNGDKLWLDQFTVFMQHRDYVQDTYKAQTRPQFISVTTNPKGGDVLTAEPIAELLRLHDQIMLLTTEDGFTWSDVCRLDPFGRCIVGGVLSFFATAAAGIDSAVRRANSFTTT